MNKSSAWLEIRLFYVRIAPCVVGSVPDHLILSHIHREIGVSLEINGSRVPSSDGASLTLRRDRLNKDASDVTYVSTDSVRVTGGIEFDVCENENVVLLCGSLERMEGEWSMDCYPATWAMESGNSAFFQPIMGASAPGIEVYIAGCCAGVPVILTKTVHISPMKKGGLRPGLMLDVIQEDEAMNKPKKDGGGRSNCLVRRSEMQLQLTEGEFDDYATNGKMGRCYYSEEMYAGEDGQLSWFNAGVRVGVGIGLGMCLGVGIGDGLLMRSYQTTTRNFRRRFL